MFEKVNPQSLLCRFMNHWQINVLSLKMKAMGLKLAASRHLQGFVHCLLAHYWRGVIYRGASFFF